MYTINTLPTTTIVSVNAPVEHVWKLLFSKSHIVNWLNPEHLFSIYPVEFNLVNGGTFNMTFSPLAGNPNIGFYYAGTYSNIVPEDVITMNFVQGFKWTHLIERYWRHNGNRFKS